MTTIDRYLLILFFKVLTICFVSLVGLYIVIDFMNNLEEFLTYLKHPKGGPYVLVEYYGPRALQFFDKTAGMLAMIAVVFAITMLQRTSELTSLMAAGIAPARVMRPLLMAAVFVSALGVANREFGLPAVRDSLSRNAQTWLGESARKCTPRYDIRTDILIAGKATRGKHRQIEEPQFQLPSELAAWGRQISAKAAFQEPASERHPAGYLLTGVTQPANLAQLSSAALEGELVLLSHSDTSWLKPGECFVVSMVPFEQLTIGGAWRNNLSSYELIVGLYNETIEPGADIRVLLHKRLLQPLVDFSLVLLGIPLVLTRGSRNIFLAAGLCAGLMAILQFVLLTCHGLGSNYLLNPIWATWIPVLVFAPLAYVAARPLWD